MIKDENGLVSVKDHPTLPLELHCYTKKAFYKRKWTDEAINSRGHVYHRDGENLVPVSTPFPKIFNINEVPETRLENLDLSEEYEIYEKLNGHLCISFKWNKTWVSHTKGGFTSDFAILDDVQLDSNDVYKNADLNGLSHITFMFEMIAFYDKHLLFDTHMTEYGKESTFPVLIGAYDNVKKQYLPYDELSNVASLIGVSVCRKFDHLTVSEILDNVESYKNIEGFIVKRVSDGLTFKIKVPWYLKHRYLKEFTPEKIYSIFSKHKGSEKAYDFIPEEFHSIYKGMLNKYEDFKVAYYLEHLNLLNKLIESLPNTYSENDVSKFITSCNFKKETKFVLFSILNENKHAFAKSSFVTFCELYGETLKFKTLDIFGE